MKVEEIRIDRKFEGRLPEPSEGEFKALCDDIAERGVLVPLCVTEDGLLLDGHRRLKASKEIGLKSVPTRTLSGVKGAKSWGKAFAIALNLRRRHLNEAQRADLGSSLLRIEKDDAAKRKRAGQRRGGQTGGRGHGKLVDNGAPQAIRATDRTAKTVGISRTTFERVENVKKKDPKLHGRMLDGKISVAGAARKVTARETKERTAREAKLLSAARKGFVRDLSSLHGQIRCFYGDPCWEYNDKTVQGSAEPHYVTLSVEKLIELYADAVKAVAHSDGAHFWLWTTWPMIREKAPHRFLDACGFEWKGEIVWNKGRMGLGRWLRKQTEICILGVRGKCSRLRDDLTDYAEFWSEKKHSRKPLEMYELVESFSPGPFLELFARDIDDPRENWLYHGLEAEGARR